jgi:hypothetical protein
VDEVEAEAEEQEGLDEEVVPPALVGGDVGEGTRDGYAKYELSAKGGTSYTPAQMGRCWSRCSLSVCR